MTTKRQIQIFTAGCPLCEETIRHVQTLACKDCEVVERPLADPDVGRRARELGIARVPAVVIDGALADCCRADAPDPAALRRMGLGQRLRG
jgi:hypothetical protein